MFFARPSVWNGCGSGEPAKSNVRLFAALTRPCRETDDVLRQNAAPVTAILPTRNRNGLAGTVVVEMDRGVRLDQKPPQRVFPISFFEIALLAVELDWFTNFLEGKVEASLPQCPQFLPDVG